MFATDRDPDTLTDPGARSRNRLLSPTESPVNGHAHIYASPTGEGVSARNLFTPSGFSTEESARRTQRIKKAYLSYKTTIDSHTFLVHYKTSDTQAVL